MTTEVLNGGAPALASESATPEAAQTNAATQDPHTDGGEGAEASPAQEKVFSQKELDEILQKRLAKERRQSDQQFRKAMEMARAMAPTPQQPSQPAADAKPTRAQYADDEQFVDALTDWKLAQRDRQSTQARAQEQQRTLAQKTESIYAEAQKLPGFDRDAFDELPLTKPIVEALIDSDTPAKLMHHLAANPAEVERIAKLSPARQAAELGKLEASLPSTPKTSKAPSPIGDPTGKGTTTTVPTDPSRMSNEQYRAWRNKQGARWAR